MNLYDRFYNKDENTNRVHSLAQALQASKSGNSNNNISAFQPVSPRVQKQEQDTLSGAGDLLTGGMKLYNGLQNSGIIGNSTLGNSASSSPISGAINDYIGGTSSSGSPIIDVISSNGASDNVLQGSISENVSGGGGGFASSAPWGMIANTGKSLYNNISGHNPKDYSDTEQGIIYPLQGAANGFSYGGPWGAAGGALYGLGYAFKDDLGLDDSNFLTQMLFPIGMGDGGGLRVNGTPILDIF